MSEESIKRATEVLKSGFIGQGEEVDEFEKILKEYFNTQNLITLNSATSGLFLAIHLIKKPIKNIWPGINIGDVILSTPLTCFASNVPILNSGIPIKWVDVDPNTCNMDLLDLERKIDKHTKAIMVVHWGGYPVDLDALDIILDKAEIKYGFRPYIIEDCAHAMGSIYKGKKIGVSNRNICVFSCQAIKHLTMIEGGIIILPNQDLYKRAKLLRWYGMDRDDKTRTDFRCELDVLEAGFKYNPTDVNSVIGIGNFKDLPDILEKHRSNANFYNLELSKINNIELMENKSDRQSSYWLYTIKVKNRDQFLIKMKQYGIMTSRVHERNDIYTCVKDLSTFLPNLDKLSASMQCIPVGWWVTEQNRNYIVDSIREISKA